LGGRRGGRRRCSGGRLRSTCEFDSQFNVGCGRTKRSRAIVCLKRRQSVVCKPRHNQQLILGKFVAARVYVVNRDGGALGWRKNPRIWFADIVVWRRGLHFEVN